MGMARWAAQFLALAFLCSFSLGNFISGNQSRTARSISYRQRRKSFSKPLTLKAKSDDEITDFSAEFEKKRTRRAQDFEMVSENITANSFVLGTMRSMYVTIEWVGVKETQAILVISNLDDSMATETRLWRSTDNGETFVDESNKVGNETVDSNSLIKNPNFPDLVLVMNKERSRLFITTDAGNQWDSYDFHIDTSAENIYFHPTANSTMLALTFGDSKVFLTTDSGRTWKDTGVEGVVTIDWAPAEATNAKASTTCYWSQTRPGTGNRFDFYRTTDMFKTNELIKEDGFDFAVINEYIFMSKLNVDEHTMAMEVSEDGGDTWNHAHFPADLSKADIQGQEAQELGYQILDASEGSVFINVDNDDWEKPHRYHTGNLYVSDQSGTMFSLSLQDHLFLQNVRNDFQKVASIVGTYITNQLVPSNGLQEFRTLISFDKGGEWKPLRAPEYNWNGDAWDCSECYLQLHNFLSEETTHVIQPIFSVHSAIGLVIAHGLVGRYLEIRNTDLFVSRDGGYSWHAALEGMWSFDVADRGGLIVAAAVGKGKQNTVVFSWDFGKTWQKFRFQEEPIQVVKVLSKPGADTRTFNIWGNTQNGMWTIVSLDFESYLGRPCIKTEDYQTWSPTDGRVSNHRCLLGYKQTYIRRKETAKCFTDLTSDVDAEGSQEPCPCTKEDFECDYGYVRLNIDSHCVKHNTYNKSQAHPCDSGATTYLESSGYRKVPGDRCVGGVEDIYLNSKVVQCPKKTGAPLLAIVLPTILAVTALVAMAVAMFVYSRKRNYWRARYIALAQGDHDDELPNTGLDSDPSESEDEYVEMEKSAPTVNANHQSTADQSERQPRSEQAGLDDDVELQIMSDDEEL